MRVKTLRCWGKEYLYDAVCNDVVCISKDLFNEINNNSTIDVLLAKPDIVSEVKKLCSQGFLKNDEPELFENPNLPFINTYLNHLKKMSLQVTQACNFKCRYCGYAGDNYLNRHHNGLSMTWEVAKKAIDFFKIHSQSDESVSLGFYGGEAFLEFDLIKKCILYAEEVFRGRRIFYNITTNGSLINNEVAKLVDKYDIYLAVSLDGPEELHNKNRRYAINGKGTYRDVLKGIACLKDNVKDFDRKVSINSVVDQREDYQSYFKFFNENEEIKRIRRDEGIIDDSRLSENIFASEEYLVSFARSKVNAYISKILGEEESNAVSRKIDKEIAEVQEGFVRCEGFPRRFHHEGPCIPGYNRLFVNTSGFLFPCEKCSENSKVMRIGSLEEGYNFQAVKALMNIGEMTKEQCRRCVVARHCNICPAVIDDIEKLSLERKLLLCRSQEKELMERIKKKVFYEYIGLL